MVSGVLAGSRILVVEDEYHLADDARAILSGVGAEIIGPVPTVQEAAALVEADGAIDCVLLDINLRGEMAFDVADVLQARGLPFVFVSGYDRAVLPSRFSGAPSLEKPIDPHRLVEVFARLTAASRR